MASVHETHIMHTFFRGWRRKAGVVTLVMACVLMGAWVRSFFFLDEIIYHLNGQEKAICTVPGTILWVGRRIPKGDPIQYHAIDINSIKGQEVLVLRTVYIDWICNSQEGAMRRSFVWIISHWSVVLPLTLLSACLILWQPRKRLSPN